MAKYEAPVAENEAFSGVDARSLSDIMHPKCDKSLFDKCGGSVEAIAATLKVDLQRGISGDRTDIEERIRHFGANFFAEAQRPFYWKLVLDNFKDMTIIMLLVCAGIGLVVSFLEEPHGGVPAWVEPVAIVFTVNIVVHVQAMIDYKKEILFAELNRKLETTNKRQVIRNGNMTEVTDKEIVVGDVLIFNNVLQSNIPADGIFIAGDNVKMDQGALTGEPEPVPKDKEYVGEESNPLIFSGTEVKSGSGKMLVIAVGVLSYSGKIRAEVYNDNPEAEPSPLFQKLDKLAMDIGKIGMAVAGFCLLCMCVMGFLIDGLPFKEFALEYLITAITILVVAVPEGLPLAVTLSLAFSSFQMSNENNLVKHLDACETMGSATTICTDKTGTLTANRMTVRAAWSKDAGVVSAKNDSEGESFGKEFRSVPGTASVIDILGKGICVNTMDESYFEIDGTTGKIKLTGQPTEGALLKFAFDLGYDFKVLRAETIGRNAETVKNFGKKFDYSSARKMMSWAIRNEAGNGYRIYCKGGGEVVMPRCTSVLTATGVLPMNDEIKDQADGAIGQFASQAMRTIAFAYRDLPDDFVWDKVESKGGLTQPDGSPAFSAECELTLVGVVGIEDPLRPEVPPAIQKCYTAGIDVRMVTGDNLQTAVAIAARCGILRAEHFYGDFNNPRQRQLKPYRAMTGEDFRKKVSVMTTVVDAETGLERLERTIVQSEFDKVWPYLRVMARCDPSDKKVLADGLNKSFICKDREAMSYFREEEGIIIFPDRQVVAMTGDGTNDAPALKRADVGFAMGISGTPTAKDAADIILLDDNFASIVTAAKWGRNVYDSIQKFLQFQLTVNISALTLATVGSLYMQKSPLSATQLLWLNLLMDSLASLALATEPPTENQLKRPPVNRSESIITPRMWYNMIGQASFQVIVVVGLMFKGHKLAEWEIGHPNEACEHMTSCYCGFPDDDTIGCGLPESSSDCCATDLNDGIEFYHETQTYSRQYTIIFNVYVLMQLVNEVNCRKLEGEWNPFEGITRNKYFVGIWVLTIIIQAIFAQFVGPFVGCSERGLSFGQWIFCLVVSLLSIPVQTLINFVANQTLHIKETRGIGGGVMKFGSGKITCQRSGSFRGLSQTSMDTEKETQLIRQKSMASC